MIEGELAMTRPNIASVCGLAIVGLLFANQARSENIMGGMGCYAKADLEASINVAIASGVDATYDFLTSLLKAGKCRQFARGEYASVIDRAPLSTKATYRYQGALVQPASGGRPLWINADNVK
jgi:hypothetical protein